MAVLEMHSEECEAAYILEPNQSLGSKQTLLVFGFIGCAILAVAIYFAALGAWLVVPFSGLEILILGGAVYAQHRWAGKRQFIRIDDDNVSASSSADGADGVSFQRAWLRISLVDGTYPRYPRRLILGSHGRYIEIGEFLTDSERELVAAKLLAVVSSS